MASLVAHSMARRPNTKRLVQEKRANANYGSCVICSLCKNDGILSRRHILQLSTAAVAVSNVPASFGVVPDTSITNRVFLDVGVRNSSEDGEKYDELGRIVIGLYGNHVPQTVSNFRTMCKSSFYRGSIFHRVFQGRFIQAGRQGFRDGQIMLPPEFKLHQLQQNLEAVSSKAFSLNHNRPGTVSLSLSENDDDQRVKMDSQYRNVEFMITTGPGPAPDLDNGNIVFGHVIQGMDVVSAIAVMQTFKPSQRMVEFNEFARILGDSRAANAKKNAWNKPVKPVVINGCGEI